MLEFVAGRADLFALHACNRVRYPVLLQSASGGDWDILFALPEETKRFDTTLSGAQDFFATLGQIERQAREPALQEIPFRGGWFAFLGYELLHALEPSVPWPALGSEFPLAMLMRIPAALLFDRRRGHTLLFGESAEMRACLRADLAKAPPFHGELGKLEIEEEPPQCFLDGVARIQHYIREGDVFQVNLARRWQAHAEQAIDARALYQRLREKNPAPFAGLADFGAHQIVSSSPERLVRVTNGIVETRPIAGTHPRSDDMREDHALRERLRAHPKERAEHIMLVDLERNDLGKICEPGSVAVSALMELRSYTHVHHIESEIRGRLKAEMQPSDVLAALFPGGTITGCPKVRTMQIIRELEATPRYAYTGSMGYVNHDGDMDFNILIRSFMVNGPNLTFKAGAGIVADSDPQRELAETRAKAKGLLRALT